MQKKGKPKIGIVILTYNSGNNIDDCLRSIRKNTFSDYICIVVDNGSTDHTIDLVQKKYPWVKIISNNKNLGFAKGNNVGIRYFLKIKTISYILILNPDTLIHKYLLHELITFMESEPDAAIAGPVITYAQSPKTIWFAGGILNRLFCYTSHRYLNKKIDRVKISSGKTDYVTGACMIINKNVLMNNSFLPEDYFMYFEDVAFCQQNEQLGFHSYLIGKSLVRHTVSASAGKSGSNELTPFRAYYYARNPFIYIKKEVRGIRKITNYLGQFFISLPYYGKQILLKGNFKSLLYYLKGMRDGITY